MKRLVLLVALLALVSTPAFATSFTNGDFELGNATGWVTGTGYRWNDYNNTLTAARILPGGDLNLPALNHSSIVTPGLDPNTGNQLNRVYSGNYSWRVEDTTWGGYASAIQQQVNNYTDPDIFFAWAAVLEAAHSTYNAATVKIFLDDLTAGTNLITREYNAASGASGIDPRFQQYGWYYWTPWQIEQITLPASSIGHDFLLSVLAADCEPTGHLGYLYLDGFGAVIPPQGPEPGILLLFGTGLALAGFRFRRH